VSNVSQIKVELQEWMGTDRSVAEAAWTSSATKESKDLKTDEQVAALVTRLANDGHSTPFESVVLRFWIKMPIQTDRQHMTHRIASHNGMSGRYRTMPSEYLAIPDDVRSITDKVKHENSLAYEMTCKLVNTMYDTFIKEAKEAEKLGRITNSEYKRYREFYRGILPQNNMTERVTVMNLRSFANYQKLRNSSHAQPEIQLVAKLMLDEVKAKGIAPAAIAALEAKGWVI
jgi:thymidylate synthase (FAD)